MLDHERTLREFVERSRQRGANYQQTRQRLLRAGWQPSTIDELLPRLYVEAEASVPSPSPPQTVVPLPSQPTEEPTLTPRAEAPPAATRTGIDAWLNTAWGIVITDIWTFVGASVIVGFLSLLIIPGPPLIVGLNRMLLKRHDGEPVGVGDVFSGFSCFWSAWVLALIPMVTCLG
ncbi:MAG: hypothetical protein ABFD94_18580, partial [Armatimonadia bacterium]